MKNAPVSQNETSITTPLPLETTKRVVVLDLDTFRAHLKQLAEESGGNAELGRRLKVTGQFVDYVIKGTRKPGPKMLKAIGGRRKVMIEIDLEGE